VNRRLLTLWRVRYRRGSDRDERVAHPDDPDLAVDLVDVVLSPPVVVNREFTLDYQAESVRIDGVDDPPLTGTITGLVSYTSLDEGQYNWLISRLDAWAIDRTPLRYVAAPDRLSAFYAPDGTMLAVPIAA
jgi:hypothetical protein